MELLTNIFENQQVRAILIEQEPWFAGVDVATILGYKNPRDTINKRIWEENRILIKNDDFQSMRHAYFESKDGEIANRGMYFINEPGVYQLIFGSKLEVAQKFQRWVFTEVLPNIRRQGFFSLKNDKDLVAYLMKNAAGYDHYMEDVVLPVLIAQEEFSYEELFERLAGYNVEKPKYLKELDREKRADLKLQKRIQEIKDMGFVYCEDDLTTSKERMLLNHLGMLGCSGRSKKFNNKRYFDEYTMLRIKEYMKNH